MAADYDVLSVMQTIGPGIGGESADVMTATFQLKDGKGSGQVSVPFSEDWASALTAAIEAQVAQMLKVFA